MVTWAWAKQGLRSPLVTLGLGEAGAGSSMVTLRFGEAGAAQPDGHLGMGVGRLRRPLATPSLSTEATAYVGAPARFPGGEVSFTDDEVRLFVQ
jgi:hypothetical protein